jgi:hypothetical protein
MKPEHRPRTAGGRYGELPYISPEAKSGKGHHVPLHADGPDLLPASLAGKTGRDHRFARMHGTPWGKNHDAGLIESACEQVKVEPAICFHELRRTYASTLAQMGVDLLTISKLLGHAMEASRVILSYRRRCGDRESMSEEHPVRLDWTACNYGGRRAWFLCPAPGDPVGWRDLRLPALPSAGLSKPAGIRRRPSSAASGPNPGTPGLAAGHPPRGG